LLGLETDVDGCHRLARVLLTFFFGGGGIVCVWEEWGVGTVRVSLFNHANSRKGFYA
jgi:hypothetical protein